MSENKNSQESPEKGSENSPASSPKKGSENSPALSLEKGSENNPASSPEKGPDSSPKCNFEGLDMEVMSPNPQIEQPMHRNLKSSTRVEASPSIQEQIALSPLGNFCCEI